MEQSQTLQGVERAAVLLMALGEDYAAEILKHIEPRDLHRIGASMANLANIDREQVSEILNVFNEQVENQTSMGVDNHDYIRNVLVRALGRDKAKGVMERIFSAEGPSGVDALKWMDARAIAGGLRREHPQVVALVLSSLETQQAAEVVNLLPEELRYDALMRVATLDNVPAEAMAELNDLIENQVINNISASATAKVGGAQQAADILNHVDSALEGPIMEKLKEADPELSEKIEDLMLLFESLLDVSDRDIQNLLRAVASETLTIALRGADDVIREKILRNMSKRAAAMLRDDLEVMPPVKLSEVEAAQKEILLTAKRMEQAGELSLGKGGNEFV